MDKSTAGYANLKAVLREVHRQMVCVSSCVIPSHWYAMCAGALCLRDGHHTAQWEDDRPPEQYSLHVDRGCVGGCCPHRGVARAPAAATVARCAHRPTAVAMHA